MGRLTGARLFISARNSFNRACETVGRLRRRLALSRKLVGLRPRLRRNSTLTAEMVAGGRPVPFAPCQISLPPLLGRS